MVQPQHLLYYAATASTRCSSEDANKVPTSTSKHAPPPSPSPRVQLSPSPLPPAEPACPSAFEMTHSSVTLNGVPLAGVETANFGAVSHLWGKLLVSER